MIKAASQIVLNSNCGCLVEKHSKMLEGGWSFLSNQVGNIVIGRCSAYDYVENDTYNLMMKLNALINQIKSFRIPNDLQKVRNDLGLCYR